MAANEMLVRQDAGVTIIPGAPQMTFADMMQLAQCIAKSNMYAMKTPEQAMVLMQLCQAKGLHPIQAVQQYHIIQGRPAMRADAMQAEFQRRGGRVEWREYTDEAVSAVFSHPSGGSLEIRWTIADAKKAQLYGKEGGMWSKYPKQMLAARVVSDGVRRVLPEVVSGIYTPEETSQFEDSPSAPSRPLPEPKILPATNGEDSRGADIDEELRKDLKAARREFCELAVKGGHEIATIADANNLLGSILQKGGPFTATDFREGTQQLIETAPDGEQEPAAEQPQESQNQPAEVTGASQEVTPEQPAEEPLFAPGELGDPFAESETVPYTAHETTASGRKRGK